MRRVPASRTALVVAHPGHELRLHGWLEQARPCVFVLTDGSGSSGPSRLASTARLLAGAGATTGDLFGALTDRDLYAAILEGRLELFTWLVDRLAAAFLRDEITTLVGDATEGYNPGHDVCRLLIDAAVELCRAEGGWQVANHAFPLTGRPDTPPADCRPVLTQVSLDDAAFARKRRAAMSYPELRYEVESVVGAVGWEAFRHEALFPVERPAGTPLPAAPFYEDHGERQVRLGRYRRVLRHHEHFLPLCRRVWQFVERRGACPACAC